MRGRRSNYIQRVGIAEGGIGSEEHTRLESGEARERREIRQRIGAALIGDAERRRLIDASLYVPAVARTWRNPGGFP
jgi:hypothetical protein